MTTPIAPRTQPQAPTPLEVRRWAWRTNDGKPSTPGVAVMGNGRPGLRLFIASRAQAEELVAGLIKVMEQPETWEKTT